jgi:hydrogenase expression/formation protein HypD
MSERSAAPLRNRLPIKFLDEFREKGRILEAAELIKREADPAQEYYFMEFCGGHTHVIFRYGLNQLLPSNIHMVHGPGCPVCVLPRGRIDSAIRLTQDYPGLILCTYADLMRVPGSQNLNLIQAKARGSDIRMVYSPNDALRIAQQNPGKKVVFLAIGFETTAPATAFVIEQAKRLGVANFLVYCVHLLTPPAVRSVLDSPEVAQLGTVKLDGFVGPGHVSSVIGTEPYEHFAASYRKPVVVSGFSPLDLLQAIALLVREVNELRKDISRQASVVNQYSRVVSRDGNSKARQIMNEVFELRPQFEWRGLGTVPESAFRIREAFASVDAEKNLQVQVPSVGDHPACACGAIIRGVKTPLDCKLFGKACTPDNPIGSCMVSSEGTCAAYYAYQQLQ